MMLPGFRPEAVLSDSAHDSARQAELRDMVGEIRRGTACLPAIRQHIPKDFSDSDNKIFHDYEGFISALY